MNLKIKRQCACQPRLDVALRRKHMGLKGLFLDVKAPDPDRWNETCFLYESSPYGHLYRPSDWVEIPTEMMPSVKDQFIRTQWVRTHAYMLLKQLTDFLQHHRINLVYFSNNGEIEARLKETDEALIEETNIDNDWPAFLFLVRILRGGQPTLEIKKND